MSSPRPIPPPEWTIPADKEVHKDLINAVISACRRGSVNTFKELYKLKAARTIPGSYLIRLATISRWPPMLEHILKIHSLTCISTVPYSSASSVARSSWLTRLHDVLYSVELATKQGDLKLVELFLKAGMPIPPGIGYWYLENLLADAIHYGQVEITAMLLNYGANPNEKAAYFSESTYISLAAILNQHAIVRLLVEHGGNIRDSRALYEMAENGADVEAGETVLDLGADINQIFTNSSKPDEPDIVGTALFGAAWAYFDNTTSTDFAKWLLDRGIDYTIRDSQGRTVLQVAEERGHTRLRDMIQSWIREHTQDR